MEQVKSQREVIVLPLPAILKDRLGISLQETPKQSLSNTMQILVQTSEQEPQIIQKYLESYV